MRQDAPGTYTFAHASLQEVRASLPRVARLAPHFARLETGLGLDWACDATGRLVSD